MWRISDKREREFAGGKENWAAAALIAEKCPVFKPDDEDEMVADEAISCYNCRYRRWTMKSFICCNEKV